MTIRLLKAQRHKQQSRIKQRMIGKNGELV
jgi:hypothetical protein